MEEEKKMSRREFLYGSTGFAAGAAIASGGLGMLSGCIGSEPQVVEKTVEVEKIVEKSVGLPSPMPYEKLDLDEVGKIAYENYFTVFCSQTVATGIFGPLAKKVGEPYASYPMDSFFWAHGGIEGWGTACGTLIGAGYVTALIAGKEDGGNMINDVVDWYANTELPIYTPETISESGAPITNTSKSNTPLCHISVGKWMKKENVGFFTAERKERCARISADIAMKTAELLNEWNDGKYEPRSTLLANAKAFQITTQNNCGDCHTDGTPSLPGA
jgi:hypothetical protein